MGCNEAVIQGGRDLWSRADIVGLVETWEKGKSTRDILGFERVTDIWNVRKNDRGRGFGGIQFVLVQELSQLILRLRGMGAVWVLGDLNARIGEAQGGLLPSDATPVWVSSEVNLWARRSVDEGRNGLSEALCQMLTVCDLTVLNGVNRFPGTHDFTCVTWNGQSVVDLFLTTSEARDRVLSFELGLLFPDSDHKPLFCSLSGFQTSRSPVRGRHHPSGLHLFREHQEIYRDELGSRLVGRLLSPADLQSDILQVAHLVFPSQRMLKRSKSWFDFQCWAARKKAMASDPDNRRAAHNEYRNFIRARKRQYIRSRQLLLMEELFKEPRLFWQHLQSSRTPVTLDDKRFSLMRISFFTSRMRW
ncbi:hypothetical protein R1sor_027192 [Riccia sorocarpa]|uniref:Endonuclease/exonuclease/phosphatase domain-containing protein n=1 Tax=Riccia sorocarpa TaxID=122646 RepID=A0ABD3GHR1_9MARC